MFTVMEIWHLKPGLEDKILQIMQMMDDMLGPPAHVHPGWCGHAQFYQSETQPCEVIMLYPWRTRELHADLLNQEEPRLTTFYADYCESPREIRYYNSLEVEVEHDEPDVHHNH